MKGSLKEKQIMLKQREAVFWSISIYRQGKSNYTAHKVSWKKVRNLQGGTAKIGDVLRR
jgi:hypothetical protein